MELSPEKKVVKNRKAPLKEGPQERSIFNFRNVPKTVVILGFVSLLTDISSDMIYPLLPIFLTQYLGAGKTFIGLIEGFAEFAAAMFTLFSGIAADRTKDRTRLVLAGYSISSFCRPLVAVAWNPWIVFLIRFSDRMGKGIRTSPRDALIADLAPVEHRGRAFGLHRSMDHTGAILGPLIASLLLAGWVSNLRVLFALAAIPGLASVALILWKVREVHTRTEVSRTRVSLKFPSGRLRVYLAIYFIFILSCSSDAFLLLRCAELGIAPVLIPMVWMTFNIVKAVTTLPFGVLSDRFGRRRMLLIGWIVYALVYFGFGMASAPWQGWLLFAAYGFFYGLTEGGERAILADYSDPGERGRVYGWHYLLSGIGALLASLIFGALWQSFGSRKAFMASACLSIAAALALFVFTRVYPSGTSRKDCLA